MKYGSFIRPNRSFLKGGGATAKLLPFQLGKGGVAVGLGVLGVAGIATAGIDNHNQKSIGQVSYSGPARMTGMFNSGAVEAINQMTDDPEVKADMLSRMMHNSNDSVMDSIEQHGVDGQFLSAFYGMN